MPNYKKTIRIGWSFSLSQFAHEIAKVTDAETGSIDIASLNPNDLVMYRSSIDVLLGEDTADYDKRMESVFGTPDYIDTAVEIISAADADRLKRIALRNPGANPLGDKLLVYAKRQQESETT